MKHRILILEDEDMVASDIQEALESFGYNVCARAKTGKQALALAEETKPDLALMDIRIEGEIDGVETAKLLRDSLELPIIFLTAYADDSTLERAMVTEPFGYILKPFKELELKLAVEIALQKASELGQTGEEPVHLNAKQESIFEFLNKIDLFKGAKNIRAFAKAASVERYPGGEFIAFEGDERSSGFLVKEGRVALVKSSSDGKDLIVDLLPPGDTYGLLAASDKKSYAVSVRAQIDSELVWIPRDLILAYLDENVAQGREFLREVFARLRSSQEHSRSLAHDKVDTRIAQVLSAVFPKFSNDNEETIIEMSRQEMAELVGSTTETVIRSMKQMESDALIDLSERGFVKIIDQAKLKDLSEEL